MNRAYLYIGAGVGAALLLFVLLFLFLRSTPTTQTPSDAGFGIGDNRSVAVITEPVVQTNQPAGVSPQTARQTVFKIAEGPIAGATVAEASNPTSTVARYIRQENGHIFELALDTPGAAPRALSNTTIPGIVRAVWTQQGNGVVLQYVSGSVVKSVYFGFPATSTGAGQTTAADAARPVRIQFLPDGIRDITASPDGSRIAYLLRTASGVAGYVANPDGSGGAALFSLPLSQVLLAWPAPSALLVTTKSAAGVPGMAFSVNASSGLVTPLLHAEGLSATADRSFSRMVYQTAAAGAAAPATYARNVAAGRDTPLSFDPIPEKCLWSAFSTSTLLCAAPLEFVPANFFDLWRLGAASAPDSILSFDLLTGETSILAIPGSSDGGVRSDILEMALAPEERYLSFITRPDRALWGVRLTQ